MDNNILDVIKKAGEKAGIPLEILYSIVMTESGGNPLAHSVTGSEDSRGLFQINTFAHPNVNSSMLFEPSYNASYAMTLLKPAYDEGVKKGLTGVELAQYVERYGERPQWTETVAGNIKKYYEEFTGIKTDTPSSGGGTVDALTKIGFSIGGIDGLIKNIGNGLKTSLVYIVLGALAIFSLYIIFVK
jgi:hypothetical protein